MPHYNIMTNKMLNIIINTITISAFTILAIYAYTVYLFMIDPLI